MEVDHKLPLRRHKRIVETRATILDHCSCNRLLSTATTRCSALPSWFRANQWLSIEKQVYFREIRVEHFTRTLYAPVAHEELWSLSVLTLTFVSHFWTYSHLEESKESSSFLFNRALCRHFLVSVNPGALLSMIMSYNLQLGSLVLIYVFLLSPIATHPYDQSLEKYNINVNQSAGNQVLSYNADWPEKRINGYHPSPSNWRTLPFYTVILDRLSDFNFHYIDETNPNGMWLIVCLTSDRLVDGDPSNNDFFGTRSEWEQSATRKTSLTNHNTKPSLQNIKFMRTFAFSLPFFQSRTKTRWRYHRIGTR